MASASSSLQQTPNAADIFDAYFRRADLDRDGRISGAEAVAFFQGSGLPKPVLAQVWNYADHRRSGFLGRAEFFDALKLITVAQSKRELTPDIVKAALYGPASAKIPAPQISLATQTARQSNASGSVSTTQAGSLAPTAFSPGPRGMQLSPSANLNQQQLPYHESHGIRPPLPLSAAASRPVQGVGGQGFPTGGSVAGMQPHTTNTPNSWVSEKASRGDPRAVSHDPNRGVSASTNQGGIGPMASGSTTSLPPRPPTAPKMMPTVSEAKDSISSGVSRNGFPSNSAPSGDAFSAIRSQTQPNSSTINIPVSAGNQPLQPSSGMQSGGSQPPHAHSFSKQNQLVSNFSAPTYTPPRVSSWAGDSASGQHQQSWPKMTQSDIRKYAKVFTAVDTDKDGKILGAQARNLFLSWRLPREILKQVWDLSDQDNDSMLSLKEFCVALYLMERYREGRSLPEVVPSSILSDLSTSRTPITGHSTASWGPKSDWPQQQTVPPNSSGQHTVVTAEMRLPDPPAAPHAEEKTQGNQQKSKVPVLEKHFLDQLSQEEQDSLNSKFKEATDSEKMVVELEKEIQDSREKIEFYRTKMQELVLYKSRCDSHLNEIIERTSADKREFESLAKKYEEKYKQVGDVASRLTIEEATFRDIQEKKKELYQSIVKTDQGSGSDDNLQASLKRIQGELDELATALNERCKQYGLRGKPTSLLELPFGWQPGIQEGAADWDENWDKFEDEGFTFVKELTLDVQNVVAPPKSKSAAVPKSASADKSRAAETTASSTETATETVSTKDEITAKSDELTHGPGKVLENGSDYDKSGKEAAASETGSPITRNDQGSPSKDLVESNTGKMIDAKTSPHNREKYSDQEGSASVFDKGSNEPAWGTFDSNDDMDSVWGFTPENTIKDNDHEKFRENYFFGSEDFGLNPIKTQPSEDTGISQKKNMFSFDDSVPSTPLYNSASLSQKKSTFSFDESVPSTPLYSSVNSPQKYKEGSQTLFDSFSRFDSFNMRDNGLSAPQENLSRFDSFRNNNEYDYGHGFSSFDDSDPFGSGPFKTSTEIQTPIRILDSEPGSGPLRTSQESQTPRSSYDSDPFGPGTFKTTMDSETPKGSSDSDFFGTGPFKTSRESQTPRSSEIGVPFN